MQLDWTTFALEVINFLVLVWLLRRFFYAPVLAVLDARQAKLQAVRDEAAAMHQQAQELQQRYESRLGAWESERLQARSALEQELAAERTRRQAALAAELAEEQAKQRARDEAALRAREAAAAQQALQQAYAEATAMLQRLATPQLTAQIASIFSADLASLDAQQQATLQRALAELDPQQRVDIASAHALDDACQRTLGQDLQAASGRQLQLQFSVMPELIAGLRVGVGQCRLDANLADELAFFRRDHA